MVFLYKKIFWHNKTGKIENGSNPIKKRFAWLKNQITDFVFQRIPWFLDYSQNKIQWNFNSWNFRLFDFTVSIFNGTPTWFLHLWLAWSVISFHHYCTIIISKSSWHKLFSDSKANYTFNLKLHDSVISRFKQKTNVPL